MSDTWKVACVVPLSEGLLLTSNQLTDGLKRSERVRLDQAAAEEWRRTHA